MHKISKLLLLTLLLVPVSLVDAKRCKSLCCLCVQGNALIRGNLTVGGTLTLGGVPLNNLVGLAGAIGAAGAAGTSPALGTLVSSIVPFSSGLITLATDFPAGLPTSGFVMGFGSSSVQDLTVPATLAATETGFAFSVPRAGTLHDLRVSADPVYLLGLGNGALPFTFTFTLIISSCTSGAISTYTSTGLSATATITPPAGTVVIATAGGAGCGSNAGSIAVAAGDRVTLLVTPSATIPVLTVQNLGLSADVLYTPAA